MKVKEIIQQLDKSEKNEEWVDITEFDLELGIQIDYVPQDELKAYWVANTATEAGIEAYFLRDEFVAFSYQTDRKSRAKFEWLNQEAALKVKEYLLSLMITKDIPLSLSYCDLEEEIGDGYKIEYNVDIPKQKRALLNGEFVEIVGRVREKPDYGIDQQLTVRRSSGEEDVVHINDLDFAYCIKYS